MTRMTWKIFAGLIVGLGLAGCDRAPPAGAGNSRDAAFERVSDPAQVARGKLVYEQNCLECHGAEGKGQAGDRPGRGPGGPYPPPPPAPSAPASPHPALAHP